MSFINVPNIIIIISDYICARVCLYINIVCPDGMIRGMYPCLLLVAICVLCYWLSLFHL